MTKIIWIASYPKSGNTFLRALISTYFFTNDGNYEQSLLKNIKEYPREYFKFRPNNSIYKEAMQWKEKQLDINRSCKKFIFLKTHLAHCKVNDIYQTLVPNFSKCIIYIYRDPRNVLLSVKDFFNYDIESAKKTILDNKSILRFKNKDGLEKNYAPILDWASNYNSYKNNKNKIPTLFIKYEDLIKDTSDEFLKILEFLKNNNMSFEINKAKISKTVNSTTFNKLKNLEKKEGFIETIENGNGKGKPFFFKGGSRDYKKQLSSANSNEIFQKFYNVMKELGYINRRVNHL